MNFSKISFLIASITLLGALFSTSVPATTTTQSCSVQCYNNKQFCNSTCAGDPSCLAECQAEYQCCLIICHNGTCRQDKTAKNEAVQTNTTNDALFLGVGATPRPVSPCADTCYADYQIARNACGQSPNPIQCLNQAKAARDACLADCQ